MCEKDDVYYFDPVTHEAVSGWLNVYPYPEEFKARIEKYISDMKAGSSGYNSGYDLLAKNAYNALGEDVFKQQYFHEDNKMAQGFTTLGGTTFYFDPITGIKATGWKEIEGKKYYFGYMGAMVTEPTIVDGVYYVFTEKGQLAKGIVETGGKIRYGTSDGSSTDVWVKGQLVKEGEDTYYIGPDGYALTGLQTVSGKYYVFGNDGKLIKGFASLGSDLYYMTENGAVINKWVTTEDKSRYYFGSNGKAASGWTDIDGITFWFDSSHHMADGLTEIDGVKYYFAGGGLRRGPTTFDNKLHVPNEKGALVKGWVTWNNKRYYCKEEGIPLVGVTKEIDGVSYTFGSDGALI
jgi:glucan-binding YG repeat protein